MPEPRPLGLEHDHAGCPTAGDGTANLFGGHQRHSVHVSAPLPADRRLDRGCTRKNNANSNRCVFAELNFSSFQETKIKRNKKYHLSHNLGCSMCNAMVFFNVRLHSARVLAISAYDDVQIGAGPMMQCACEHATNCVYNNGTDIERGFNPTGYSVWEYSLNGTVLSPPITNSTPTEYALRTKNNRSHLQN